MRLLHFPVVKVGMKWKCTSSKYLNACSWTYYEGFIHAF